MFVSHATADKWVARVICERIESVGAKTFRDDRDIAGGDDIPDSIRAAIERSDEMIVLLTPASVNRPWVLMEVGAACEVRKMTLPATISPPSIFLSYSLHDRHLADDVARVLAGSGLTVVRMSDLEPGGEYTDSIRRALRKSAAVVVVLSQVSRRRELPASVLFEVGAAVGADKPIFVVIDEPSAKLPFNVPHLEVLPTTRIEEIAHRLVADVA